MSNMITATNGQYREVKGKAITKVRTKVDKPHMSR